MPGGMLGGPAFFKRSPSDHGSLGCYLTTPTGTKMLAITAVLQLVGALSIKKIVAIKV